MKIINSYILKESRGPIVLSVSIFTFIFLLDIIVTMMESIIVKGISVFDVARILSFYVPPILTQTLPLGLFVGIMITFSKFTRSSEAIAMNSIGMDIRAILKPILYLGFASMFFILFLQESIIPRSYIKLQYLSSKIAYENPVFRLKERTFMNNLENYSLYIDKVGRDKHAKGILIFENDKKSTFPVVLVGHEAYWRDSSIVLEKANFISFDEKGVRKLTGSFEDKRVELQAYFSDLKIKVKETEMMSIATLLQEMKGKTKEEKLIYKVEIHRKLALPFSSVMLSMLGVFLSIGHQRSGKKAGILVGILTIFFYISLLNIGIVLANVGKIPILLGVWLPNLLLAALTYRLYLVKKRKGI
ncbi:permease, YjgP/YjgQ family [Fusobacterium necrophorum subsp. funduliforme ATCC 51357]|uniref:LptF/LptG family permease n=1 Tax=Fusobacterium necrophorum TaxID=859 RepID=UPI00025E5779|nr:LptF/LptG family permease [Fusobacterium necrophorum]EIJ72049.1 permease, YjgP/YjgQ family [Fusobacterium necrophorum subsp. funduliforme ATCC 51357]KAB0553593.1 YjgP/YjgQ family permease [Fusobacterium necrophorum subsp. funduliforme]